MKSMHLFVLILLSFSPLTIAHNKNPTATYMGNEAILVTSSESKILFDPLFHKVFGQYQAVPETMLESMFIGKAPFDNINAIFISHAHGDHFNAQSVLDLLKAQTNIRLFAPRQAIEEIKGLTKDKAVLSRTTAVALQLGDSPWVKQIDNLLIEAVRVPHGGYPYRHKAVENLVFRVTLDNKATVMHMGDAEPDDQYFKPHDAHWKKRLTHTAFPPYWFYSSQKSQLILDQRINAKNKVGVHVPVKVPGALKASGLDYFSKPGETRVIE